MMLPTHVRTDESFIRSWIRAIEAQTLVIAADPAQQSSMRRDGPFRDAAPLPATRRKLDIHQHVTDRRYDQRRPEPPCRLGCQHPCSVAIDPCAPQISIASMHACVAA